MDSNLLNLTATIEQTSGFCFGVVNAIKKAEKQLETNNEIYCLGQIVHNEEEVERLQKLGMKTVSNQDLDTFSNKSILIRAHGEPPSSFEKAKKNNNTIIDATCPIVLKLQKRILTSYLANENIFIFGKKQHPEVIGLNGQTNNTAVIFASADELKEIELPKSITLYSQTTMSIDEFQKAVDYLKSQPIDLKINDTICRQVSDRRQSIKQFCQKHDIIIFVGGKDSSNGKELSQICKSVNEKTYYVNRIEEINTNWFAPHQDVGICGATSTPQWQLEQVKKYLSSL